MHFIKALLVLGAVAAASPVANPALVARQIPGLQNLGFSQQDPISLLFSRFGGNEQWDIGSLFTNLGNLGDPFTQLGQNPNSFLQNLGLSRQQPGTQLLSRLGITPNSGIGQFGSQLGLPAFSGNNGFKKRQLGGQQPPPQQFGPQGLGTQQLSTQQTGGTPGGTPGGTGQLQSLGLTQQSPLTSLFGQLNVQPQDPISQLLQILGELGGVFAQLQQNPQSIFQRFNMQPQDPIQQLLQQLQMNQNSPIGPFCQGLGLPGFNGGQGNNALGTNGFGNNGFQKRQVGSNNNIQSILQQLGLSQQSPVSQLFPQVAGSPQPNVGQVFNGLINVGINLPQAQDQLSNRFGVDQQAQIQQLLQAMGIGQNPPIGQFLGGLGIGGLGNGGLGGANGGLGGGQPGFNGGF